MTKTVITPEKLDQLEALASAATSMTDFGPLKELKEKITPSTILALIARVREFDERDLRVAAVVRAKFQSGNELPVERITITRQELATALRAALNKE